MPGPFAFAWAGGSIQPQDTLVTNGTTHGGVLQTVSIVGDTQAGQEQLTNLATNEGLQVGAYYGLSGPGIEENTFFIYDTTILTGINEGSVNISKPAGQSVASATFTVTRSIVVGDIVATISQGSNVVNFVTSIDMPSGTYVITGTGIAQTATPVPTTGGTTTITTGGGTGVTIIPSAYFVYDGSTPSVQMFYLVATPHTTTGVDSIGQPVERTTHTIAAQPANATTTGQFAFQITGMPDADWYAVTGIPSTALATLQPGLRYNISGNGIQVGTTFIAPAPGATSIEIDQPATSSDLNAILTITGPRTPDAPFDATVHNRMDEEIVSLEIAQEEGNFATLSIELKNPNVGLLAVGRNLWCWLSWDQNWTPAGTNPVSLVPLFNGRLIGVPKLQAGETVQLQFLARPDDFGSQKASLASALSVLPYYDPVWLAANVNLDTVLETYSVHWYIDRTSLGLAFSDILQGEAGTVTIGEDKAFYDNFSLSYGEPPLVAVTVTGTVSWNQEGDGLIDITPKIVSAFGAAGSPYNQPFPVTGSVTVSNAGIGGGGLVATLLGDGLKSDWPRPGTNIGGGWSLATRNDDSGYPYNYCYDATRTSQGGWLTPQYYQVDWFGQIMTEAGLPQGPPVSGAGNQVAAIMGQYQHLSLGVPITVLKVRMTLQYAANRRRTETVTAVMTADVQRELSDSADQDRDQIQLTSDFVSQGVDPGGGVPIGSLATRSYFQTDRGAASFEYMLLAARAKMRARARAVEITFATDWRTALGIGLRHSVTYLDRRLPGGSATGKVKSYRLSMSDAGMMGEFTIGCSIGNGDPSTAVAGINTYVEDEYVAVGYQVVAGGQSFLINDELAYQSLDDFVVDDDGLDLTNITATTAVNEVVVANGLLKQLNSLSPYQNFVGSAAGDPVNMLRTLTTTITIDLKPVAGAEFHTDFFPAVSTLSLPKTIDLAAPTEGPAYWDVPVGGSGWDSGGSLWDGASA